MNNNKHAIRDKISRKRTSLEKNKKYLFDEHIYKKSVELIETIPGNSVFIYESFEGEVSTKKIISKLRSKNYKISTPRVGENREMIAVDISNEKLDFSKSPLSKKILDSQLEVVEIDIVLVPVVAFSKTGGRVGYGGGFYDEWYWSTTDCSNGCPNGVTGSNNVEWFPFYSNSNMLIRLIKGGKFAL